MSASEAPDLRLLPLAAGVWAGAAATLAVQPTRPALLALATVVVLALAAALWHLSDRARHRDGPKGRQGVSWLPSWWAAGPTLAGSGMGVGLAGVLIGVGVAGAHLAGLDPALVRSAIDERAVLEVTARVTGDPRAHQPANPVWSAEPSWTAEIQLEEMGYRGSRYTTSLPALARGRAARDLIPGTTIAFTARAGESWSPARHALSLQLLGTVHQRAPPGPIARGTNAVRAAFRQAVADLPPDAGALLLGLAVGDESTLPADLADAMVLAGLSHLTAVSGSNTSLVVGLTLAALTALGTGWRLRAVGCLTVLGLYVELVRPQPSVLRAAVMGVVALVAFTVGGRRRGPPALCAGVILLVLWRPELALAWGFALSVAATGGLLLMGPSLTERLGRWPATRWAPEQVRGALAVAMAAHLATLPLTVGLGNGAGWVALPANVLVAPLVPVATIVGLAAALLAAVLPGPAALLAWLGAPATAAIAGIARAAAVLPWGVLPLPGSPGAVAATAALVGGLILMVLRGWRPWRNRWVAAVAAVIVVAGLVTWRVRDLRWPPPGWLILVCDVGQGDGVLLRGAGSRNAILVDAGPAGSDLSGCIRDAGVDELTVVLTHFHADHVDGLPDVLGLGRVHQVLTTPVPDPAATARRVIAETREAGVPVATVQPGERWTVAGVALTVLWPARRMDGPNDSSVVLLAEIAAPAEPVRALLTGDVEPPAQAALLARGISRVDVVKVPHHGSAYQDPALAQHSQPAVALVSVGADNAYGHPSEATLAQYAQAGASIGRTDTMGALAVVPGGRRPTLVTER